MPTKTVSAETMEIGRKGGGKHWTDAEVSARKKAADQLKRNRPAVLVPPEWLSKDAITLWDEKITQVAGLRAANALLDVLDTELLAMYCDAVVQYRDIARPEKDAVTGASKPKTLSTDDVKALQAWSRIIRDCAEKLGFTPSARARLVKKIADDGKENTFGKKFD